MEAHLLPTSKFKTVLSVENVMAAVLWNAQGILLDFLPVGETMNAAHYCGTLNKLREAVCQNRPGKMQDGVIMLHDSATPHTARQIQQWLQHPAHSPNLASLDFHLFRPLKQHLSDSSL
jgi:hypothetical protein